jgi:anti-sigma factor RsiW
MVHRDVIIDLIPLYLSGDASAETRKLVEEAAKSDPELAKQLAADRELLSLGTPPSLPPDHEKRTLDRTKASVRWRTLTFAAALVCTFVPFTFSWESGRGFSWLLWRASPIGCGLLLAAAVALWSAHLALQLRLRRSGI